MGRNPSKRGWRFGMTRKDEFAGLEDEDIDASEMTGSDTQVREKTHRLTQSVGSIKYY